MQLARRRPEVPVSIERVTAALNTAMGALLVIAGSAIVGGSAAIIIGMDASAGSQGERYYVAIMAILALIFVDRQMARVVERSLPWSIGTAPEERRYHRWSYLLLLVVGLSLLGLAHYKTVGASWSLAVLLGYGLAVGLAFFVVGSLVNRFLRTRFETPERASRIRTFSLSFGSPSIRTDHRHERSRPVTWPPELAVQYREAWNQIQLSFEADPAEAVRRAHRLVLELCESGDHPGVFVRDEHLAAPAVVDLVSVLEASTGRIEEARRVQAAVQAALAGEPAEREYLARAMVEYDRLLEQLLDG